MALGKLPIGAGAVSGSFSYAAPPTGTPAAFVKQEGSATNPLTTEVLAGEDRLLVVSVSRGAAVGAGTTATYGGVAMQVANNSNAWCQLFYMLNPPVGSADVVVSGTNVHIIIATHYTGIASFGAATQSSAFSQSFSPSGPALIVFAMTFTAGTPLTPLTETNERYDAAGDYYGDRIVTDAGTYSVGVTTAPDPDSVAAFFNGNLPDGSARLSTMAITSPGATSSSSTAQAKRASTNSLVASGVASTAGTASARRSSTASLVSSSISSSNGAAISRKLSSGSLTGPSIQSASGTGTARLPGTLTSQSPSVTSSGTATARLVTTAVLTSPAASSTGGAGTARRSGTQTSSVPLPTSTGTGASSRTSSAVFSTPIANSTGLGTAVLSGTLTVTSVPVGSQSGVATASPKTSSLQASGPFASSAGSSATARRVGSATAQSSGITSSGAATARLAGSLQLTSSALTSSTGAATARLVGNLTLTAPALTSLGTGTVQSEGSALHISAPRPQSQTSAAQASRLLSISGNFFLPQSTGSGSARKSASLDLVSSSGVSTTGLGNSRKTFSLAGILSTPTSTGVGTITLQGTVLTITSPSAHSSNGIGSSIFRGLLFTLSAGPQSSGSAVSRRQISITAVSPAVVSSAGTAGSRKIAATSVSSMLPVSSGSGINEAPSTVQLHIHPSPPQSQNGQGLSALSGHLQAIGPNVSSQGAALSALAGILSIAIPTLTSSGIGRVADANCSLEIHLDGILSETGQGLNFNPLEPVSILTHVPLKFTVSTATVEAELTVPVPNVTIQVHRRS